MLVQQVQSMFRQRMRMALSGASWTDLSVGVASLQRDGCLNGQALLNKADERLYDAKRAGKGRCHGLEILSDVALSATSPLS